MSLLSCLECLAKIDIEGGEKGDYVECDTCACEMIITHLEPAKAVVVDDEK